MKKVSIILLSYNHEKYIAQAIESILLQKGDFEIKVLAADDCSTDNTRQIIEEYSTRYKQIVILERSENIGATRNWINAYNHCDGDYMCTLEGDDYWIDDEKIKKQIEFLEQNPNYIGIAHTLEGRDLAGKLIGIMPNYSKDRKINLKRYLNNNLFSFTSILYNSKKYKLSEQEKEIICFHRIVADFTVNLITLMKGDVFNFSKPMAAYRVRNLEGETNYNSMTSAVKVQRDCIKIINNFNKNYPRINLSKLCRTYLIGALVLRIKMKNKSEYKETLELAPKKYVFDFRMRIPFILIKIAFRKFFRKLNSK